MSEQIIIVHWYNLECGTLIRRRKARMKPDEVVNALRACNRTKGHRCSECPALGRYNHRMCKSAVDKFAADHIESLQAELAKYEDSNLTPAEVAELAL